MSFKPENLRKGLLIEAKDAYGTWYPAKIIGVRDDKIRVHFCNWSSRYDAWFPKTSDSLRPLKRVGCDHTTKQQPVEPSSSPNHAVSVPSSKHFDPGVYVMALWRNQYEYLAEVLAYRCRQNEKPHYKIRFIWDNVIEWTSAEKLRKATQFEIDYVLKFCREHSGSKSRKTDESSTLRPGNHGPTSLGSPPVSCVSKQPTSVKTPTASNDAPTTSLPRTTSIHGSDCIEQDDMLYDKSVFQFHEACRKRRELKRQAVEQSSLLESNTSSPGTPSDRLVPVEPTRGKSGSKSRRSMKLDPPAEPSTSETVEIHPATPDVSVQQHQSSPYPKNSPNRKASTPAGVPSQKPTEISVASPKTDPETKPKPVAEVSSPTTYPCPHCPRILRHSKLLTVHLANYHKDVQMNRKNPPSTSPVLGPRKVERLDESVDPNSHTRSKATDSSNALLSCHPCGTRRNLIGSSERDLLIQCDCCQCWMHRSCHTQQLAHITNQPFYCNGCMLNTRPVRASRLSEPDAQLMLRGQNVHNHTLDEPKDELHRVISDLTDLVNQSHDLRRSLMHAGWMVFNNTKLPESSPKKSAEQGQHPSEPTSTDKLTSEAAHTRERSSNDDHLNRLLMEFRASIVDNSHSDQSSRVSLPDEEPSFSSTLPDPAACWSLPEDTDEVDSSAIAESFMTNHVLTGFLQDLGPNVISELVELGAEPSGTTADDASIPDDLFGKRIDRTSDEPCDVGLFSATETPTKGLGPLLSSPAGVATLLQATISNSFVSSSRSTPPTSLLPNPLTPHTQPCVSTPQTKRISSSVDEPWTSAVEQHSTTTRNLNDRTPLPAHLEVIHGPQNHSSNSSLTGDIDWLPLSKELSQKPHESPGYDFPPLPSVLSKSDSLPVSTVPTTVYDNSFGLDTIINDVLTPDVLFEAQTNLDHLEEHILIPLENALCAMEAQLDLVTEQLAILDGHPGSKAMDEEEEDCNSDSSSHFASSSSFSLSPLVPNESPRGMHDVDKTKKSLNPAAAVSGSLETNHHHHHLLKRTARRIYRHTLSRRFYAKRF